MPKSKVTKYYEERLKNKLFLERPTNEEALGALDLETGIELFKQIQELQMDFDYWARYFVDDSSYAGLPHYKRHLDTIQEIRKALNNWRALYSKIIEDYRWIEQLQQQDQEYKQVT